MLHWLLVVLTPLGSKHVTAPLSRLYSTSAHSAHSARDRYRAGGQPGWASFHSCFRLLLFLSRTSQFLKVPDVVPPKLFLFLVTSSVLVVVLQLHKSTANRLFRSSVKVEMEYKNKKDDSPCLLSPTANYSLSSIVCLKQPVARTFGYQIRRLWLLFVAVACRMAVLVSELPGCDTQQAGGWRGGSLFSFFFTFFNTRSHFHCYY